MKRILATMAATAIAFTTLAVPASAEVTGTQTVCDPASGQVRLNAYFRENKFIDAKGGFFGCDQNVDFTIRVQLKNLTGWSNKVELTRDWPHDRYAITTFTCTGQGTKTYRAQMVGYRGDGSVWTRQSSNITVKC
ncbi:MAG TPA: hypothetical protein VGD48_31370 [Kutzneria sp.]|jgi:hypothetical protein